jgi:small-conductance mechanosensitive channel
MLDPANTSASSAVQQAIWQAFREHGIEIPYPHQVQVEGGAPLGTTVDATLERGARDPQRSNGEGA